MMMRGIALLAVLWLQSGDVTAPAHADQQYFRWQRPVLIAPGARAGQTCFTLDPAVFPHAQKGLDDLRLYANGAEVPFVLHTPRVRRAASERAPAVLNLGRRGNQIVFDTEMFDASYDALQLDIAARDFVASVVVSGSNQAGGGEATRLGTFTIFDLTSQKLDRSTVLHLPLSNFRYLHLSITGPLAAESIRGATVPSLPGDDVPYQVVAESRNGKVSGRNTTFAFDLAAKVPIARVTVVPQQAPVNFRRPIRVDAEVKKRLAKSPEVPGAWTGVISRIHMQHGRERIDEEEFSIETSSMAPFNSDSHWIVTIDNGDDAPLPVESVRLEMREQNVCFDALAGTSYLLAYGDAKVRAPRYDYASFFQYDAGHAPAMLEPEQANPGFRARPDDRAFTEKHPALLWIALILAVGILGWVALRTAVRLKPGD